MHPTAFIFALAGLAGVIYVFAGEGPDLIARLCFVAATVLIARDTLDADQQGFADVTGPARFKDLRRWHYTWAFGAYFMALFTNFNWDGPQLDAANLLVDGGIGVIVGAFIAFTGQSALPFAAPYDRRLPADRMRLGRFVYFGWPFAVTAIVFGSAMAPPDGGWQGVFPLFQLTFLPFLVALYPIAGRFGAAWPHHLPRLVGFALMIAALILA